MFIEKKSSLTIGLIFLNVEHQIKIQLSRPDNNTTTNYNKKAISPDEPLEHILAIIRSTITIDLTRSRRKTRKMVIRKSKQQLIAVS